MLAAVHTLATSKGKWDNINGLIALGVSSANTYAGARNAQDKSSTPLTLTDALKSQFVDQFNPLNSFGSLTGQMTGPDGQPVAMNCTTSPSDCLFTLGVSFRYSAFESQKTWTESHIARKNPVLAAKRSASTPLIRTRADWRLIPFYGMALSGIDVEARNSH